MCVWVSTVFGAPAWGGPGTPVLHPAGVRLLPIEVAATYDLTHYRPDTTPPGTAEAHRPRGGLKTTQEIKEYTYFPLMLALAARGYSVVVGEHAPTPPHQLPLAPPDNSTNRQIRYPFCVPGAAPGSRVDVPKIHTIILGVLGSIPAAAVRAVAATGVVDAALWHDLTTQLAADLHGSFSIPAHARRVPSAPVCPIAQPRTGDG